MATATKKTVKKYTAADFVDTKFHTAEDKAKFTNEFIRFADGGFKGRFTKRLYQGLSCSGYFGFIAHYDINGFQYEKFSTAERCEEFMADLERVCARDMHLTSRPDLWFDVKKVLVRHFDFCPF